jgi:hypothetical protein
MVEDTEEELTQEISQKSTEKQVAEPGSVDVCGSPSEAESIPIPYPDSDRASETSSGSKAVKISGKEVSTKESSSYTTSTGDEAGQSDGRGLIQAVKKGLTYKAVGIPIWMWSVGLVALLLVLYVVASFTPRSIEPIDEPIHHVIICLLSMRMQNPYNEKPSMCAGVDESAVVGCESTLQ